MSKEELGVSSLRADRATRASTEPASGLSPDGRVSTDVAHSPLPWIIHAERIDSRAAALEELTFQLDHTKELASHLYLLNADGLCPALTGCGPNSKANAEFIVRACNSHYELLEALEAILAEDNPSISELNERLERGSAAVRKARGQ